MLLNISRQNAAEGSGGVALKRFSVSGLTDIATILSGNYTEYPALFASGHSHYIKDVSVGGIQTCTWYSGGPTWIFNDDYFSLTINSTSGSTAAGEPWQAEWAESGYGIPVVTQIG